MIRKILILFFSIFISSAQAGIGLTKQECDSKYGKPVRSSSEKDSILVLYNYEKLQLGIHFYKNRAYAVGYFRMVKADDISESHAMKILRDNVKGDWAFRKKIGSINFYQLRTLNELTNEENFYEAEFTQGRVQIVSYLHQPVPRIFQALKENDIDSFKVELKKLQGYGYPHIN